MSAIPKFPGAAGIHAVVETGLQSAYLKGRLDMIREYRAALQAQAAQPTALAKIPATERLLFTAMWQAGISLDEIGDVFGLPNERAVRNRAQTLKCGPRFRGAVSDSTFSQLWEGNVPAAAIAQAGGMADEASVHSRAHALGLKPRRRKG